MIKVLVAEDDKFLASAYNLKFSKAGFEAVVVSDGVSALETLKTFFPDVILLDLMMPVKDGFTTLEEIKKDPKLSQIPILVASNLGQKEDIDRAMGLGAVGYVVKSDLALDDLVIKIREIAK